MNLLLKFAFYKENSSSDWMKSWKNPHSSHEFVNQNCVFCSEFKLGWDESLDYPALPSWIGGSRFAEFELRPWKSALPRWICGSRLHFLSQIWARMRWKPSKSAPPRWIRCSRLHFPSRCDQNTANYHYPNGFVHFVSQIRAWIGWKPMKLALYGAKDCRWMEIRWGKSAGIWRTQLRIARMSDGKISWSQRVFAQFCIIQARDWSQFLRRTQHFTERQITRIKSAELFSCSLGNYRATHTAITKINKFQAQMGPIYS